MLKKLSLCAALAASVFASNSSYADVIYELDYNSGSNANYDQADPGGISTKSYTAATGLDGSTALQVDFDTTGNPFSVSYFTNLSSSAVNVATSGNAADYDLSFDIRVEGLDTGVFSVSTQYDLVLNDVTFRGTLNSTTAYQPFSVNLATLTNVGSGTFDLADIGSGTQQFRVALLNAGQRFGNDTNNSYFVDNVRLTELTAVPEPSSLAFMSLAMLGGVTCWRKRRSS
ncbi:PEP-CTERM motif protein [Rubripirellula amarantea]|uniref:PEP-CTERM motif protein n=1 Tax=Rubripirellula amarantea TaxID=2527999 RepID=A0A5C5WK04_9BACT|nr:PEP-CTERM sorting domain-containing protein [Rubripirellula amarantea]TWT50435.1 PEP-CTERM motif protein [Rubripirellula amarantea]